LIEKITGPAGKKAELRNREEVKLKSIALILAGDFGRWAMRYARPSGHALAWML